ncbi:hypothetical protein [Solimicrobium silvestre]|uniref:Outer membrane insertion C-terminal signal n=1 Tax=Solimicrobium silvestre TaxID=2099400 RepID=A0A2S9H1C3_9BURK|nr:hypothetical protein [Solimicrobium silvestre]PRC93743.1 Outer membrane insertion C-terminal signal [Solimicrobium silvestre]
MKKWFWMLSVLIAHTVLADEPVLSLNAGTTGFGVQMGYAFHSDLQARLGVNLLDVNTNRTPSDINYDLKLKLRTLDMLLDWYPLQGAFHLSGGVMLNGNKFTGVAQADGNQNYVIQGDVYNAAEAGAINAKIDYRTVAPYLGVGWDTAHVQQKGWGFNADLGVMFQGSANTSITNTGCTLGVVGGVNLCQNLDNDLAGERNTVEDKANKLRYLPVLRAGINYKF